MQHHRVIIMRKIYKMSWEIITFHVAVALKFIALIQSA